MQSLFTNKAAQPNGDDLERALGHTFPLWLELAAYAKTAYPKATGGWNFPGEKFGWSFRINDNKRALIYLLPRDNYFKVAFVFGQKATDAVLLSAVAESIKTELQNAKVYAEGRGIRIAVRDAEVLKDIKQLLRIKLAN